MRLFYYAVIIFAVACFGCSPRVSYSVRLLHEDPKFSGRMLGEADIALLPILSAKGVMRIEELESESMASSMRSARADLKFVPHTDFENGFPARFDRRELAGFYAGIFGEDVLAVKEMDGVWEHVKQPYIMAFSLIDGASVRNMDGSTFKHVTVKCELWSRDGREVVWRASCKGVSDDGAVDDARLIVESVRRLAEAVPATMPNYGRENW